MIEKPTLPECPTFICFQAATIGLQKEEPLFPAFLTFIFFQAATICLQKEEEQET